MARSHRPLLGLRRRPFGWLVVAQIAVAVCVDDQRRDPSLRLGESEGDLSRSEVQDAVLGPFQRSRLGGSLCRQGGAARAVEADFVGRSGGHERHGDRFGGQAQEGSEEKHGVREYTSLAIGKGTIGLQLRRWDFWRPKPFAAPIRNERAGVGVEEERMRKRALSIVALVAALGVGILLGGRFGTKSGESTPWAGPLVLEKVKALGDLHTVSHTYQRVFEFETSQDVEGAWSAVPAASNIVQAATRNHALVSANGSVEAGVDLTQARYEGTTLVMPAPKVYEPNVKLRVHDQKTGLFWRDQNLAPKATESARAEFRVAAMRSGILKTAKENAERQVRALVGPETVLRFEG
ncbi:DUF4230 domain-containing protein [bacterium]|nr:MAG: DUF4230 domain-containing protein [bacterium]